MECPNQKKQSESAIDNNVSKDLHLVFKTTVEDIRFAKLQQWRMTYYALILMGSIRYLKENYLRFLWEYIPHWLLIAIIAITSIFFVNNCEKEISNKYRKRIDETRAQLSPEFQSVYELEDDYLERRYKIGYFIILCSTITIAAILLSLSSPVPK